MNQSGFTLIELVIVIVILGILAATALPRFSDISADARYASLQGLSGSIRSAASIARATQLAKGYASNQSITLEGYTVNMANGYPSAAGISAALGDYTGFTPATSGTSNIFTVRSGCSLTYTESTGSGIGITIASGGC